VYWWSLVYVTPDGMVRYIIYSHSHVDHIAGAGVFADSHPHIIGQERMILNMDGEYPYMPGDMIDRNNDGKFEAAEIDFPADALVTNSMRSLPRACGMFDQHPLAEGHGLHTFTKQDVIEGKQFFEDLRDAVQQGMAQGKSMAELKQTIKLDKYKDWAYYNRLLPDDIEAAYQNLEYYR
jgi:hypothetical protein